MADIEKNILINLEASLGGAEASIDILSKLGGISDKSKKHLERLEQQFSRTSRSIGKITKSTGNYNRTLAGTSRAAKLAQKSTESFGKIVKKSLVGASAATVGFGLAFKHIGDTLLKFQTTSINTSNAIETLSSSYGSLAKDGRLALVSMQDLAAELIKFQTKGIVQSAIASQKEVQKSFLGMLEALSAVQGKGPGAALMEQFTDAFGANQFKILNATLSGQMNKISTTLSKAVSTRNIDQIKKSVKELVPLIESTKDFANDQGLAATHLISTLRTLAGDGSLRETFAATMAVNESMVKLGTAAENAVTILTKTFGQDVANIINGTADVISKGMAKALVFTQTLLADLKTKFQDLGGVGYVVAQISSAFTWLSETIQSVISFTKSAIDWFSKLATTTKLVVAAFAISPVGFITGISSALRAMNALRISIAASTGQMTGLSLAARGVGIAIGGLGAGIAGHLGGKTIANALGAEQFGFWEGAAGAATTAGVAFLATGNPIIAAVTGVGSALYSTYKHYNNYSEAAKEAVKSTKGLADHQKQIAAAGKDIKAIENGMKKQAEAVKNTKDEWSELQQAIGELETSIGIIEGMSGAASKLGELISTLGPNAQAFGESIAGLNKDVSLALLTQSFKTIEESSNAVAMAISRVESATEGVQKQQALANLDKALKAAASAAQGVNKAIDASLAPLKKQQELVSLTKDLRQLDLDISRSLYGTPALAVQAQLDVINAMQGEKELLEQQLALVQSLHAQRRAAGDSESSLIAFKQKELELAKSIRSVTADQLRQVKELRDGYLDAIKEQAVSAGRFEKIIVTRDKNLMKGLQKRMVAENFLLGQTGDKAKAFKASPYKYSAQSMGQLESLTGQALTAEDVAREAYGRVENIGNDISRAASIAATDAWMNVTNSAYKNANFLADNNTQNTNRVVDAISLYAEDTLSRSASTLGLKGSSAGETAFGSAMDRFSRQLDTTNLAGFGGKEAAEYVKAARESQTSQGGINAMIKHQASLGGAVDPAAAAANVVVNKRQIDAGLANTFFKKGIQYFDGYNSATAGGSGGGTSLPTGLRTFSKFGLPMSINGTSLADGLGDLRNRDKMVRQHEKDHYKAAGSLARSRPRYNFQQGPDGKRYAIGGEVLIDAGPASSPLKTIQKMQQVQKAALAPRNPSEQDLAVAEFAAKMEAKARRSLVGSGVLKMRSFGGSGGHSSSGTSLGSSSLGSSSLREATDESGAKALKELSRLLKEESKLKERVLRLDSVAYKLKQKAYQVDAAAHKAGKGVRSDKDSEGEYLKGGVYEPLSAEWLYADALFEKAKGLLEESEATRGKQREAEAKYREAVSSRTNFMNDLREDASGPQDRMSGNYWNKHISTNPWVSKTRSPMKLKLDAARADSAGLEGTLETRKEWRNDKDGEGYDRFMKRRAKLAEIDERIRKNRDKVPDTPDAPDIKKRKVQYSDGESPLVEAEKRVARDAQNRVNNTRGHAGYAKMEEIEGFDVEDFNAGLAKIMNGHKKSLEGLRMPSIQEYEKLSTEGSEGDIGKKIQEINKLQSEIYERSDPVELKAFAKAKKSLIGPYEDDLVKSLTNIANIAEQLDVNPDSPEVASAAKVYQKRFDSLSSNLVGMFGNLGEELISDSIQNVFESKIDGITSEIDAAVASGDTSDKSLKNIKGLKAKRTKLLDRFEMPNLDLIHTLPLQTIGNLNSSLSDYASTLEKSLASTNSGQFDTEINAIQSRINKQVAALAEVGGDTKAQEIVTDLINKVKEAHAGSFGKMEQQYKDKIKNLESLKASDAGRGSEVEIQGKINDFQDRLTELQDLKNFGKLKEKTSEPFADKSPESPFDTKGFKTAWKQAKDLVFKDVDFDIDLSSSYNPMKQMQKAFDAGSLKIVEMDITGLHEARGELEEIFKAHQKIAKVNEKNKGHQERLAGLQLTRQLFNIVAKEEAEGIQNRINAEEKHASLTQDKIKLEKKLGDAKLLTRESGNLRDMAAKGKTSLEEFIKQAPETARFAEEGDIAEEGGKKLTAAQKRARQIRENATGGGISKGGLGIALGAADRDKKAAQKSLDKVRRGLVTSSKAGGVPLTALPSLSLPPLPPKPKMGPPAPPEMGPPPPPPPLPLQAKELTREGKRRGAIERMITKSKERASMKVPQNKVEAQTKAQLEGNIAGGTRYAGKAPAGKSTLNHGVGGNWQNKMRAVSQMLQEMGSEVDRIQKEQSYPTQYGSGRDGGVLPTTP